MNNNGSSLGRRAPLPVSLFRASYIAASLLTTLFVLGCSGGPNGPQGATVSGKVTVDGKAPGTGASVMFHWDKDTRFSSVGADGSYTIVGAPSGPATITVTSTGGTIPPKYAAPDNGLTFTVTSGAQTFDIDLKK